MDEEGGEVTALSIPYRQTFAGLDDLSALLREWYDLEEVSLAVDKIPADAKVPATLISAWLKIGRLSLGYAEWVSTGHPAPLACQDGFAAPGSLFVRDGIAQVVTENQGNWAIGYRHDDPSPDPDMYSDFIEQEIGGTGFVPMGCRLSDLIVTTVLTETVFFGSVSDGNTNAMAVTCDRVLWTGHYYNAVGQGAAYERPSHQIRTNDDGSLLCLFWDGVFSGFVAERLVARARFQELLDGRLQT